MKKNISTKDASKLLGVSIRRINALITSGKLKSEVFSGVHIVDYDSLVERLKSYKKLDLSHAIAEAKILGEWQRDKAAKEREEEQKQIDEEAFAKKLLANSKDMPPHFVHLVSDNFWELLDYAEVKT